MAQKNTRHKELSVPGINIQYPISQLILSGTKTIETRTYEIPKAYIGIPLALVETPGPDGDFPARAVALIRFSGCFRYKSEKDFYQDSKRHAVDRSSPWRWMPGKPKWAWIIDDVTILKRPQTISQRRGIVFTKQVNITL